MDPVSAATSEGTGLPPGRGSLKSTLLSEQLCKWVLNLVLTRLLEFHLLSESQTGVSESFPQRTVVTMIQENIDATPHPVISR